MNQEHNFFLHSLGSSSPLKLKNTLPLFPPSSQSPPASVQWTWQRKPKKKVKEQVTYSSTGLTSFAWTIHGSAAHWTSRMHFAGVWSSVPRCSCRWWKLNEDSGTVAGWLGISQAVVLVQDGWIKNAHGVGRGIGIYGVSTPASDVQVLHVSCIIFSSDRPDQKCPGARRRNEIWSH